MFDSLIRFIRATFQTNQPIPLHAPVFMGNERAWVLDAIDSTFVSSVGAYVDRFERDMAAYTKSPGAVVTVNGTSALHIALKLAGVSSQDYVITQALTFIATCNAIAYCNAEPVFIDVDRDTLGLSPNAVDAWLDEHAFIDDAGICRLRADNRVIRACVPMHTFGHPAKLDELVEVCNRWGLALIEDAAESLGSLYKGRHTGTFGQSGILSFNGNKIMTTGGGGMILTNEQLARRAKHLTTTAKIPHPYEYVHDEIGYNYRMPNINAALGCAQLEQLEHFIDAKRRLARQYAEELKNSELVFVDEPAKCRSNFWLNAVICENREARDQLLEVTNKNSVMTRPIWELICQSEHYRHCPRGPMANSVWLRDRVVNLPSSVIQG